MSSIHQTEISIRSTHLQFILIACVVITMPLMEFPPVIIANKGIRFDWLFCAFLIGSVFIVRLLSDGKIRFGEIQVAAAFFLFASFCGLINAVNLADYLTLEIQLINGIFLIFCASNIHISENHLVILTKCYILVSGLLAIYAIYQFIGTPFGLPYVVIEFTHPAGRYMHSGYVEGIFIRPTSLFSEPRRLGLYILGPLTLMVFYTFFNRKKAALFNRTVDLFLCVLFITTIILLRSLATYLLLILSLLFVAIKAGKIIPFIKLTAIIFLSFFLLSLLSHFLFKDSYLPLITKRFMKLYTNTVNIFYYLDLFVEQGKRSSGTSLTVQVANIIDAIRIWWHYPIVGIGLNNYGHGLDFYLGSTKNCKGVFHILATMGIAGFASFFYFLFAVFKSIFDFGKIHFFVSQGS